jgi:ABC-type glycerol-3-phosphate transport system permease component
MATVTGNRTRRIAGTAVTWIVLAVFAYLMIFPFLFMFMGSFKESQDVFTYPPRVLPRTQASADLEGVGEDLPLYRIPVGSEVRDMALVRTGVPIGVFAPADDPEATVQHPLEELEPTGATAEVDGEELPVFAVPVEGGGTVELVQVGRTVAGEFVDPDDPSVTTLANVRTSEPAESVGTTANNYSEVLGLQTLDRSLTNTALVTILVVVGTLFTSIMGGYAFARIRFPGRDQLFLVYLGSFMVPFVVLIIPLYQLMVAIGWVDRLAALIIPFVFSVYGTFLMRQFFITIPKDLEEAAFVDGASRWTVLWRIFVPLAFPAIATLSTFTFLYAWNSFVWPLVVINAGNTDNHVLTLSLQILGGRAAESPNLIFAGVTIGVAVPVLVFILAQRYFVENVATSGIK